MGEGTPFRSKFNKLDLKNVIELACGRGRHVHRYLQNAGKITLVDILEKNMDICRSRFRTEKKSIITVITDTIWKPLNQESIRHFFVMMRWCILK